MDPGSTYLQLSVWLSECRFNESFSTPGRALTEELLIQSGRERNEREGEGGECRGNPEEQDRKNDGTSLKLISIFFTLPLHNMTIIYLQQV